MSYLPVILSFLIALLGAVKFHVVGEITAGEILLLGSLPFLVPQIGWLFRFNVVRLTVGLGLLYFVSLVFSDLFRHTPPADYLRGWAKLAIMLVSFVALGVLIQGRLARFGAFFLGAIAAPFLNAALYGVQWEPYKFYFGIPVSMLAFLIFGLAAQFGLRLGVFAPVGAAAVAYLLNCRSLAGTTFVAALYSWLALGQDFLAARWRRRRPLAIALLLVAAGWGALTFYQYAAPKGLLGTRALVKFEAQSDGEGQFEVLNSRNEILYAWPKISESPLIGWGSWARDPEYVLSRSEELGLRPPYDPEGSGLIPTHSHLTGAWLEAGLLGGVFWFIIFLRAGRLLLRGPDLYGVLGPLVGYLTILFLWDMLFSPFGGERRVQNGFLIWMISYPLIAAARTPAEDEEPEEAPI